MASDCQWICVIPFPLRELVLRVLLISALTNVVVNIIANTIANNLHDTEKHSHSLASADLFGTTPVFFAFAHIVIPLLIILHHISRLWPRRYWLVICEVVVSLVEVVVAGAILVPDASGSLEVLKETTGTDTSVMLLQGVSSLFMSASSFISFIFLLCDILSKRGKNILSRYDFSAGLCRPGRQWSFIFGRFTGKKRYGIDGVFMRCVRGGIAILCLLVISFLVFYALILQPVQWSKSPETKIFKVSVPNGGLGFTLENIIGQQAGGVFDEGRPIQAIITKPNISASDQHLTVNMNLTYFYPEFGPPLPASGCTNGTHTRGVFASCPDIMVPGDYDTTLELLITLDLSGMSGDPRVYLGMTDSVEDILNSAEPINLAPGLNLHGFSSISVKERLLGRQAAALGISQYRRFAVINARALMPDSLPSLPRNNNTATLRITIQSQPDIQVEQEYLEGSVVAGLALIGGTWTLINGVFAAIFGSTLLLVLFGIKPLSIYGFVHRFRSTRVSLADGDYVLSPEERDRIVGILREHLLDVDDAEGAHTSSTSSPNYSRLGILPQFNHSHCDAGTQT